MTAEERLNCMRNDLIEGQLSIAQVTDKYFNGATSALRDSLISQLEALKYLYNLRKVLND